jgi:hypothetical protein
MVSLGKRSQSPDRVKTLREWIDPGSQTATEEDQSERHGSSGEGDQTTRKEFHSAPSIVSTDAGRDADALPASAQSDTPVNNARAERRYIDPNAWHPDLQKSGNLRPSVARRVFDTVARGVLVVALFGVAFALLSSEKITAIDDHLASAPKTIPHESVNAPDDHPAAIKVPSEPAPPTIELLAPLRQQLEKMSHDLATMQRIAEQIAARQDKMAQDVVTLQAAQKSASQQILTLQAASVRAHSPIHRRHLSPQ